MKNTLFVKAGQVKIEDVDRPTLQQADDAILKIVRTCVCGSDLWAYRGLEDKVPNSQNGGHEALAIVEETGSAITTLKKGDFVIVPFTHGCGHCAACLTGYEGSCLNHKDNFSSGAQAEYMRYQHAEWSLIKVPGHPEDYTDAMLDSLLTLSDVMATGYHAARVAHVGKGDTVVVMGDGAVGLCGVIAAKMRGAKRIIAMSRHADRQALAKEFGATDIVPERGNEAVEKVMALTHNQGADAVLECVGNQQSTETALQVGRPGSTVGRVGLPHVKGDFAATTFYRNVSVAGGPASVTTYVKGGLLKAVLDGEIHPGKVFTDHFKLDNINDAYQAMANRETIKAAIVMD